MATPFSGKTFTFTQPDGTKIQVRGYGDQHYAVFETLDGYTVVKNPNTGFFEIAQLSNNGTMLEPAAGPQGHLDGARAAVRPGLRINRETARARGLEGALRWGWPAVRSAARAAQESGTRGSYSERTGVRPPPTRDRRRFRRTVPLNRFLRRTRHDLPKRGRQFLQPTGVFGFRQQRVRCRLFPRQFHRPLPLYEYRNPLLPGTTSQVVLYKPQHPSQHCELSLEQADGDFRLETTPNQFGDSTDLYGQANKRFANATSPDSKWWDGTASHLDISEISAPGDTVSFRTKLSEDGANSHTIRRESTPGRSIPDNQVDGVTDSITIDQDEIIASAKVSLDITHPYRGDLQVTLLTPWGAAVLLQQRNQGGSADHIQRSIDESDLPALATFHGRSTQGDWRLSVQDLAPADVGALNRWAVEFTTAGTPQGQVVLEEAPGTHIPDHNAAGIQRSLTSNAPGLVGSVEVSVDISHSYIGDLRVSLRAPAGTEAILHNETGGSGDNLVKTDTSATTAALGSLAGQAISGTWRLSVSDRAVQDAGKLNTWRVVIQPAP